MCFQLGIPLLQLLRNFQLVMVLYSDGHRWSVRFVRNLRQFIPLKVLLPALLPLTSYTCICYVSPRLAPVQAGLA